MLSVIYAECHLCWVSFMPSVAKKPFMLSVICAQCPDPITLSPIKLNVIVLSVMVPFFISEK
jgi:hypothetical protein